MPSLTHTKRLRGATQKKRGERHTKKANLLQRSHNSYECLSTPAFIHAPPIHQAHSAPNHASALSAFDSRTTHARTLLPEALAYVPFGFILFEFEFYDASITDRNAGLYVRPRTLAFLDAETLLRKLDTLVRPRIDLYFDDSHILSRIVMNAF